MKKSALFIFVPVIILISSCVGKVIKDCGPNCEAHGFCDIATGICDCDFGYEGADCSIETRARFLGTYNVKQDSNGVIKNYTCIISNGPSSYAEYGITITPLNGHSLDGRVTANNTINIDNGGPDFLTVSGSGNLNNNIINLNVAFDPFGLDPSYTMTLTLTK